METSEIYKNLNSENLTAVFKQTHIQMTISHEDEADTHHNRRKKINDSNRKRGAMPISLQSMSFTSGSIMSSKKGGMRMENPSPKNLNQDLVLEIPSRTAFGEDDPFADAGKPKDRVTAAISRMAARLEKGK